MAELSTSPDTSAGSCCAPDAQATCCEPSAKAECCDPSHDEGCGCEAGKGADLPAIDVREQVRARYAAAAIQVTSTDPGAGCCAPSDTFDGGSEVFGSALYALGDREQIPDTAALASLGCGNPTAVADLNDGEIVLDLGSGGGIDVLLSAKRVGPTGLAYGLDMTEEMLSLARENQRKAGIENVRWLRGHIEAVPLPGESVDVVISNCVINLSADKDQVLREVARVLRPGGRLAVSDVVAGPDMDHATPADVQAYTGCIAGALTRLEYEQTLAQAGLTGVEIRETHRVHPQAGSAIIRARKPTAGPVLPPMVSAHCTLTPGALGEQMQRYGRLGTDATGIERQDHRLVITFDPHVDTELLDRAIAVERECCPFLSLDYDNSTRRLSVEAEPGGLDALDAVLAALTAAVSSRD